MLTSTYTLVALKNEQAGLRARLMACQDKVRGFNRPIGQRELDQACADLSELYRASSWRKVEMYLIPAMREASHDCDTLLAELGTLTHQAYCLFDGFEARVRNGEPASELGPQLRGIVEAFCGALLARLGREDQELLPLAHSVLSGQAWFAIANASMTHDARLQERRQMGQAEAPALQLQLI
jgi:hypothetical protein